MGRFMTLFVLVFAVVGLVGAGDRLLHLHSRGAVACARAGTAAACPPNAHQAITPVADDSGEVASTVTVPLTGYASCAEMVAARLGGITAIGGIATQWRSPDWAWGAWEYVGPATQLRWPGFGFFDTWPDYGGRGITRNFTTPSGDAATVAASFHCEVVDTRPPDGATT